MRNIIVFMVSIIFFGIQSTTCCYKDKQKEKQEEQKKEIIVHNKISNDMLGYTYLFVTYHPSSFSLSVDDKKVDLGKSIKVVLINNCLKLRYRADFLKNWYGGTKDFEYTIPLDAKEVAVTFKWEKNGGKLLLDKGTPVAEKDVETRIPFCVNINT